MNKEKFKKNAANIQITLVFIIVVGGIVGGMNYFLKYGVARQKKQLTKLVAKNQDARFDYLINSPETYQINRDIRILDSLTAVNEHLFAKSADEYCSKIDAKYTMGRFFSASNIAKINTTLAPYIANIKDDKRLKSVTPLRANTTINDFEYVVRTSGIVPEKLRQFGVEFDCGHIFMFQDAAKQKLFLSYVDEIALAFNDDDSPNFDIREVAPIRAEYTANNAKMDSIQANIARNDSIRGATLERFDRRIDSLQNKLDQIIALEK